MDIHEFSRPDGKRLAKARRVLVGLALSVAASSGFAANGFITTHEAALDAIFAQTGFVDLEMTIDVRFNPALQVANTALLTIGDAGSDAEFDSLQHLSVFTAGPTINLFFVDAITYCNGAVPGIVGCGAFPGNLIAVRSSFAATANGGILIAHELGHNFGLDHFERLVAEVPDNLMNPSLSSISTLLGSQITSILASPLVQIDNNNQRFISITPIAVVASIPEPQTWALLLVGLFVVGRRVLRRKACPV